MFKTTVIPNRGAWLEFEQDSQGVLWVHVDRKRKICATVLLRALGFGSDAAITDIFGDDRMIAATIEKDTAKSEQDGLIDCTAACAPAKCRRTIPCASTCTTSFSIPAATTWSRSAATNSIKS